MEAPINLIKNDQEYVTALRKISELFHARKDAPEGDTLEVLTLLVAHYESQNFPLRSLTPIEALKAEMQDQDLTQSSLAKRFGISKRAVSQILNGKKQMSVRFMKFLHHELGYRPIFYWLNVFKLT